MKQKTILKNRFATLKYLVILVFLFALLSCEKDKEDKYVVEGTASFKGDINGESINLVESVGMPQTDNTISWVPVRHTYGYLGIFNFIVEVMQINLGNYDFFEENSKNTISVAFVDFYMGETYDENWQVTRQDFEAVFSKGSKAYSPDFGTTEGVIIEWIDAEGMKWTSSQIFFSDDTVPVTINDDANKFVINFSAPQSDLYDEDYAQYIDASFECNLYNMEGDMILLKNGRLKSLYMMSKE